MALQDFSLEPFFRDTLQEGMIMAPMIREHPIRRFHKLEDVDKVILIAAAEMNWRPNLALLK